MNEWRRARLIEMDDIHDPSGTEEKPFCPSRRAIGLLMSITSTFFASALQVRCE